MFRAILLATLLCVAPSIARAASGDMCNDPAGTVYNILPWQTCVLLADGIATGTSTATPAASSPMYTTGVLKDVTNCSVAIGKGTGVGCLSGNTIVVEESTGSGASPNAWHKIGSTITGSASPAVSINNMFRRPIGYVRVSYTIAATCSDLDVVMVCEK